MVMGVCLRRFYLYMNEVWAIVCSELGQCTTGCTGECCFKVMYGEWYGICDFVVFSVVEICVEYGGVNAFHVCCNLCVVYLGFVLMSEM